MLFNSLEFMIFFPVVCLIYYVIPHRVRYIFLYVLESNVCAFDADINGNHVCVRASAFICGENCG